MTVAPAPVTQGAPLGTAGARDCSVQLPVPRSVRACPTALPVFPGNANWRKQTLKCFREMHCTITVLSFGCFTFLTGFSFCFIFCFVFLLYIFKVLLSYYFSNVESRCVPRDISVYLWAPTQSIRSF